MCRVFPSNLGPMPMRWFDGLRKNSISSFKKLTQSFCSRFITCSRVPQPLDSLLSMSIREGNPEKCNHNLYCQYHQDHGHTTEGCRSLWDHLDQLVREGKLKQLLHHSSGQGSQASSESRRDIPSRPPLGTINVIFAIPGRTGSCSSRVMSIARLSLGDNNQDSKRVRVEIPLIIGFSDEDKIETIQPHDDALVITLRIGGYDVKRVMVDQGSVVEIIYSDLYKGLNLKSEDLTPYSSPLVSFEGKLIIPKGQIRLPVQTGSEMVEVDLGLASYIRSSFFYSAPEC